MLPSIVDAYKMSLCLKWARESSARLSFVPCPVVGPVNICVKSGANPFWMAVQPTNVVTGVLDVRVNGRATSSLGSCYYFLVSGGAQVPMHNMTVDLKFLNGSVKSFALPPIQAASCTNGFREVVDGPMASTQADAGGDSSGLVVAVVVAAVLGMVAAAFVYMRIQRQRRQAALEEAAFGAALLAVPAIEASLLGGRKVWVSCGLCH